MEFEDCEVSNLDLVNSPDNVARLIVRYLCGKNYDPQLTKKDKEMILTFMANAKESGLDCKQLNELLLLLNQDTVREDFFNFFFGQHIKSLDDLKKGIAKFRGFAMLCFGNFKFAYRQLALMNENELVKRLAPYCEESSTRQNKFEKRPPKMLHIKTIPREKTWYLGQITGAKVAREIEASVEKIGIEKKRAHPIASDFLKFAKKLVKVDKEIKHAQRCAFANTDIYLTWDYMDVYIATSMRNKWEFEETYDFLKDVVEDPLLKKMNIRYFDPTQSMCSNPRDKGLLEGLMLKRVLCAIYLAQESDTMGKDSELAATLAQGKPVIAYVPKINLKKYSRKIAGYPLSFFKRRLRILDAEGVFEDQECAGRLKECDKNFYRRIAMFSKELEKYHAKQPFSLWIEKEIEFKRKCKNFSKICEIIAIAECYNFDKRAELLKGRHPLCIQVDLRSGVANGVLVVRDSKECAELLFRILTNREKFKIKHIIFEASENRRKEGYTVLEEEISGCAFRVVTDHERLTNSFWNLFA